MGQPPSWLAGVQAGSSRCACCRGELQAVILCLGSGRARRGLLLQAASCRLPYAVGVGHGSKSPSANRQPGCKRTAAQSVLADRLKPRRSIGGSASRCARLRSEPGSHFRAAWIKFLGETRQSEPTAPTVKSTSGPDGTKSDRRLD